MSSTLIQRAANIINNAPLDKKQRRMTSLAERKEIVEIWYNQPGMTKIDFCRRIGMAYDHTGAEYANPIHTLNAWIGHYVAGNYEDLSNAAAVRLKQAASNSTNQYSPASQLIRDKITALQTLLTEVEELESKAMTLASKCQSI